MCVQNCIIQLKNLKFLNNAMNDEIWILVSSRCYTNFVTLSFIVCTKELFLLLNQIFVFLTENDLNVTQNFIPYQSQRKHVFRGMFHQKWKKFFQPNLVCCYATRACHTYHDSTLHQVNCHTTNICLNIKFWVCLNIGCSWVCAAGCVKNVGVVLLDKVIQCLHRGMIHSLE